MKKTVFFFILVSVVSIGAFAQWSQSSMNAEVSRLLREARQGFLPNGCGPAGSPEALVKILDSLGSKYACDIHDRAYETLGKSKEEADSEFYQNMINEGVPRYLAAIFYSAVSSGGQTAYNNAQAQARRVQER